MSTDASLDAARLTGLAPQFLVDDIETAIAYYRDKLGFALDFKYESFYAGVSRDGLVVHLKQASKLAGERAHRRQNEHLDAYISVTGVKALHQELETRGARITDASLDVALAPTVWRAVSCESITASRCSLQGNVGQRCHSIRDTDTS